MNKKETEVGDEILLDDRESAVEDVENCGNAARYTDAQDDEENDNVLYDLHFPSVSFFIK